MVIFLIVCNKEGGKGAVSLGLPLVQHLNCHQPDKEVHLLPEAVLCMPCCQCGLQVMFLTVCNEWGREQEPGTASSPTRECPHTDGEVHLPPQAVLLLPCCQCGLQVTYSDVFHSM
jgi:hypothetical protein